MSTNRREFLQVVGSSAPTVAVAAVGLSTDLPEQSVAEASQTEAGLTVPPPVPTEPTTERKLVERGLVQAKVSARLLQKADRLFAGSVTGRIVELLQNARRAGATEVEITTQDLGEAPKKVFEITVVDNGHGVEDFGQLVALGHSGWGDEVAAAEDPAGAGFFSLAPRDVLAASRGRQIKMEQGSWVGMPIKVTDSEFTGTGLELVFEDAEWTFPMVEAQAIYSGLRVTMNGYPVEPKQFLLEERDGGPIVHVPEMGLKFQVAARGHAHHGIGHVINSFEDRGRAVLNFHGQTIRTKKLDTRLLSNENHTVVIDMTGEPTDLRMILPARIDLFDNEAVDKLELLIEKEMFSRIAANESHKLPYHLYKRGRELGFDLPESVPCYEEGAGTWNDQDGDTNLVADDSFPPLLAHDDNDGCTIDLLADRVDNFPFRPVTIAHDYADYSWAKSTKRVVRVVSESAATYASGRAIWQSNMTVVDDLQVTLTVSEDGAVKEYGPYATDIAMDDDGGLLVTRKMVFDDQHDQLFFVALGGYDEDCGDEWETQYSGFIDDLTDLRNSLRGPHEGKRRALVEAANRLAKAVGRHDAVTVTVRPNGTIVVQGEHDGSTVEVAVAETPAVV